MIVYGLAAQGIVDPVECQGGQFGQGGIVVEGVGVGVVQRLVGRVRAVAYGWVGGGLKARFVLVAAKEAVPEGLEELAGAAAQGAFVFRLALLGGENFSDAFVGELYRIVHGLI